MAMYYLIALLAGALIGSVSFNVLCVMLLNRSVKRTDHLSDLNYDLGRLCDKLDLRLQAKDGDK